MDLNQKGKRWELALYIAIFIAIPLVLFKDFFNPNLMLMASDQVNALGIKQPIHVSQIEDNQFATWNPGILGGMPTGDATAGDFMYPLAFPFDYVMPLHKLYSFRMIIHVMLAGITFFFMLYKGFSVPMKVAFVGGLFYMLNPQFFSHVYPGHDGKMYVIAWLPFVVWHLKNLMKKPGFLSASLVGLGVGMSLLTSHIQMTYFVLWGLFAYWVFYSIADFKANKDVKLLGQRAAGFWGAMFLGLGVGAVQIYPAFMFVNDAWSVRGTEKTLEFVGSWSLHWPEFFGLIVPDFSNYLGNYWSENYFKLNTEYVGAMATLGAVLAFVTKPNKYRIFWACVGIVALLFSMGNHTPLLNIAYHTIPGVDKFRAISMIMFWHAFATVLLSILFMKDLVTGFAQDFTDAQRKKWGKGFLIAIGVVTACTLLASNRGLVFSVMDTLTVALPEKTKVFNQNFANNFVPALWGWWFMVSAILASLYFLVQKKIKVEVVIGLMLVFTLIDTLRVNKDFVKFQSNREYRRTPYNIKELQKKMKKEPFRIYSIPGTFGNPNIAGFYKLEDVNGYHDNEFRWYRDFAGKGGKKYLKGIVTPQGGLDVAALGNGNNRLNIAGVQYYVGKAGNGDLIYLENRKALPRIAFTTEYVVADSAKSDQLLFSEEHDSRQIVILDKEIDFESKPFTGSPVIPVKWEKYTVNHRIAKITVPEDGIVRIAEVYYGGWEILVDGEEVTPLQSDKSWMAIPLKKGEYEISMKPKSLYLSTAASVTLPLSLILTIYWIIVLVKRLKGRKEKEA